MMLTEDLNRVRNAFPKRKETERLILESKLVKELNGLIKKLNDEVDALTKQKIYLQSKLKENKKT